MYTCTYDDILIILIKIVYIRNCQNHVPLKILQEIRFLQITDIFRYEQIQESHKISAFKFQLNCKSDLNKQGS